MASVEKYDDLIVGSGIAGKFTAWTRNNRRRTAIVARALLGGACPNVACLAKQEHDLVRQGNLPCPARRRI
jgi:pyruvate/2-oxoglutarate dehydrogenase complex dihydrolipoamide dehydrogenase (E3) component